MTPAIACWASRHPYPTALRTLLPEHTIVHVRNRWKSIDDCYFDCLFAANYHPDVLLFVLPLNWREHFVRYVAQMSPDTLCIQPVAFGNGGIRFKRWFISPVDGRCYWEPWGDSVMAGVRVEG